MTSLTSRQWLAATLGLWACFFAVYLTLDGPARIAAGAFVAVGFLVLCVERWQNLMRNRRR